VVRKFNHFINLDLARRQDAVVEHGDDFQGSRSSDGTIFPSTAGSYTSPTKDFQMRGKDFGELSVNQIID